MEDKRVYPENGFVPWEVDALRRELADAQEELRQREDELARALEIIHRAREALG